MKDILNKQLLFVSGKGGVGKSTISKQLALTQAQSNKKTLLVEINAQGKKSQKVKHIDSMLDEINLSGEMCFKSYVLRQIKLKFLYDTFFNNTLIQNFIRAVPGLYDLLMLGKITELLPDYESVIVDLPASGHGLSFLKTPYVAYKVSSYGPLYQHIKKIIAVLGNQNSTSVVLVTLLEELSVYETIKTYSELQSAIPIHLSGVWANQYIKPMDKITLDFNQNWPEKLKTYWQAYEFLNTKAEEHKKHVDELKKIIPQNKIKFIEMIYNGIHPKDNTIKMELF